MSDDVFGSPENLRELTAYDLDGRPIGRVGQVYVDDWDRRPRWVTVRTGLHGDEETFVPLNGAQVETEGVLRVAYDLDTVKGAPREDAEQHLGLDQEQELYLHYGMLPPEGQASGAPGVGDDRPTAPLTGDDKGMDHPKELADEPPADPPRPRLRKATASDSATDTGTASDSATASSTPTEAPEAKEPTDAAEADDPQATTTFPPPFPAPESHGDNR